MKPTRAGSLKGLAVAVAVAVVGACAGLPLPGAPDESLVLISTDVVSESWPVADGTRRVAGGQMHFLQAAGGRDIVVSFTPAARYVSLAVAPGQYYLRRVVLDMEQTNASGQKGTWQAVHDMNATFYSGPNSVQILAHGLVVFRSGRDGWGVEFNNPVLSKDKAAIAESIKSDRRWPAWEEYQLVNFE